MLSHGTYEGVTTTMKFSIHDIVNTQTYPITDPNAPACQELIERCRSELQNNLYCAIPDFVSASALESMATEARALQGDAYHNNSLRNCYLHRQLDPAFDDHHARNLQDRSSTRMIAYDQIPSSSALKTFYHHEAVRSLIAEIVGQGELFDNKDPYQPANYVCYQNGDESSWHFDADNSFTMTLMIQAADHGGLFEMSPQTRSDADQNYDHVAQVLNGERDDTIVSIGREPGALCIFKGSNSLHRVTPVEGSTLRFMGVFVYEFSPGVVGDPEVNATIYGPRVAV